MIKIEKENEILTLEQIQEIKETFGILSNNSDQMDVAHLKTAMMGLGLFPTNDEIGRLTTQIKILRKMNKNDELKQISFKDFAEIVTYRIANRRFEDDCKKTFRLLSEGKNEITDKTVYKLVEHFHENLTNNDVQELVNNGDVDKNGTIGYNDFIEIMRHTNYY